MPKKKKIADLDLKESDKRILGVLGKPRRLPEIAAKLNIGYSATHQKLSILEARGHINKIRTMRGKVLYELNNVEL